MKIIVSGSSGLVGTALVPYLTDQGHDVVRLVRAPRQPSQGEATWDPANGELDPSILDGAEVVVNLNGRSIGQGRWNAGVKNELRSSRIDATTTIAAAIARCEKPPSLLINASAVGYYGDRGDEVLDESSTARNRVSRRLVARLGTGGPRRTIERHAGRSPPIRHDRRRWRRPREDVVALQARSRWTDGLRPPVLAVGGDGRCARGDSFRHRQPGAFRSRQCRLTTGDPVFRFHEDSRLRPPTAGSSADAGVCRAARSRRDGRRPAALLPESPSKGPRRSRVPVSEPRSSISPYGTLSSDIFPAFN